MPGYRVRSIAKAKASGAGAGNWKFKPNTLVSHADAPALQQSQPELIENSTDEPWVDFCRGLKRPAFLLPFTEGEAV